MHGLGRGKNKRLNQIFTYRHYADRYYQILLLLFYLGVKTKNQQLMVNSLINVLIKIWNGRRNAFLPYCNPNTMRYVITNMLNKKFITFKYETPLSLISSYFVPSLIKKYGDLVAKNPVNLKILFSQAYSRIFQLFYQQPKINPATGKKEATGGLAALYYKAHNEGLSSKDAAVHADEETGVVGYDQYGTSHEVSEIVSSTTDYIVLNKPTSYPEGFISQLNRLTHVSRKVIEKIALSIHDSDYHDYIEDLLSLILTRLQVKSKADISSTQFILDLKKKVISSKNNNDSRRIIQIMDILLDKIFKKNGLLYSRYSKVQRIQIHTTFIHILIYNLKKVACRQDNTVQVRFLQHLTSNDLM